MKQTDTANHIWYLTENGETKIGFTPEFIERLKDCFHVVPGKRRTAVRENGPLMAVETNDCLFSVRSPVGGIITFFNTKAQDFPEKLTDDEVVCIISDKKVEVKEKGVNTANHIGDLWTTEFFTQQPQAAAQPRRFVPPPPDLVPPAPMDTLRAAWRLVDAGAFTAEEAERGWGARPEGM